MTEQLSPATQAVLDAFQYIIKGTLPSEDRESLAAALRAAADQVEPDDGVSAEVRQVLDKLLAIAAELEQSI